MRFRSAWFRMRSLLATVSLGVLLAVPVVLLPAAPVEAHCGCHGTLCSDVSKTIDHCLGEISSLKDQVAEKAAEITRQANIISTVTGIVTEIRSTINGIVGKLTDIANQVADIAGKVTLLPGLILDFFHDLVTFIAGFHPNALYGTIVGQLNEGACHDLPAVVNSLDLSALPNFPFKEILPSQIFSLDLPDLVGIDPMTATPDDLLRFKTLTDTPIQMLLDMTELPFKLPVGFAAALSQFCVNATERYLDESDAAESLRADIHHSLALGSAHGRGSVNAMHQLPAAHGGFLEEVRGVLGETIEQFAAAGERVDHDVFRELDRGDSSFDRSRFRDAYRHYQKAYAKLTRAKKD